RRAELPALATRATLAGEATAAGGEAAGTGLTGGDDTAAGRAGVAGGGDTGDTGDGVPVTTVAGMRLVVAEVLGEVLGAPPARDRAFYELGLTSLDLARVHEGLRRRLGHEVPRTTLFEHPTVDRLAAHLAEHPPAPQRAAAPSGPAGHAVAIIGMAGRFPGAPDLDAFWANVLGGVCSVRRFTAEELPPVAEPGFVGAAGVLDGVDEFDAGRFGMTPLEAARTDPAQRLFLQCCGHALEHAGYGGEPPGRVGVFAGSGMNLYPGHDYRPAGAEDTVDATQVAIGTQPDFLATRVAYRLGLTGPAMGVRTACSSALVAVHLAARSLLAGECELALAGAAAVHVPQVTGYRAAPGSILSPSGDCRPFDAAADGTVGGSGVAVVLLKPLAAALADGDTVHAVLLGSAIGNDGADKVSFTAPGLAGQVRGITGALDAAGVSAATIGHVEAHATGTELGDPIEVAALTRAFRRDTDAVGECSLGSVKANVGHLDSAAGMAGLLKAVLMLRAGTLPPQPGVRTPNPALELDSGPFTLLTRARPWRTGGTPRRALVAALGVGGT
ncbi:MAG TPA: type I polyketide synthase, partial [Pseudonocardiaceae bacterium]